MQTIKDEPEKRAAGREPPYYQATITGNHDWVEFSPGFDCYEEAVKWGDKKVASGRPGDSAYVQYVTG